MQESKKNNWTNDYGSDAKEESQDFRRDTDLSTNASSETDGWQQYRKWISKAPVPKQRRGGIDPSLYTWKGYRNWTEQVKRNWSED